ncbi:deaminase domain-containing protein [Enterococcus sp. AZ196]|uniref:deaminase domain-containing protein n=1 Tax=Enterococcus sp. AZ196 TaxID=2774659 RepID=UPI003D2ADBA5
MHSKSSLGYIADFSLAPSEKDRIFKNYVNDGYSRYNDTEAIASRIKDLKLEGEINIFSELDCCQSCTNIVLEFRGKFQNIKINIFTNNTLK